MTCATPDMYVEACPFHADIRNRLLGVCLASRTNNRLIFQPVPGELKMNSKWGLSCHSLFFKCILFSCSRVRRGKCRFREQPVGKQNIWSQEKKISLSLSFFLVHWQSRNKEKSLFIIHSPVLVVRADVMSCRVEWVFIYTKSWGRAESVFDAFA